MALLTMLFSRNKRTEIQRTVGERTAAIGLDATINESFSAKAEATSHPVEDGADVTDHVIIKPKMLSIEGIVTTTPFSLGASIQGAAASIGAKIGSGLSTKAGGALGAVGGGLAGKTIAGVLGQDTGRVLGDVVKEFLAIRDSKIPVTIQTGLTLYENYALISFQAKRDQQTGESIRVSLEFMEIIRVSSKVEKIPIPAIKNAVGKNDLGRQSKKAVEGEKAKGSSFAYGLAFGK